MIKCHEQDKTSDNRNVVHVKTLHTTKEPALTEIVKTNIKHVYISSCIHEHKLVYINIPLEIIYLLIDDLFVVTRPFSI